MTNTLTAAQNHDLMGKNIMRDFGRFLRLHIADGDASPQTIRSYHANAVQFVAWCEGQGIAPAKATGGDILAYRRALVAEYQPGTVAVELAAVRRLYEAATWHGMRQDNPAAGADDVRLL